VNAAPDSVCGVGTELMSELQNPDTVEGSAGDQPCGRVELEIGVQQRRKGTAGSIDAFQKATIIDGGD
jgi:hypothetical protein